jgi:hypothetical protein
LIYAKIVSKLGDLTVLIMLTEKRVSVELWLLDGTRYGIWILESGYVAKISGSGHC